MITILLHNPSTASALLASAYELSRKLKKDFGVMCYAENETEADEKRKKIDKWLYEKGVEDGQVYVNIHSISDLAQDCERLEVSFLFIQWSEKRHKQLRNYLKYCRDLRIPYLFFNDEFSAINFEKVLVPVGFLVEEYEKTQFAAAFGRFCASRITLLQANDYGSKAQTTVDKMQLILDKFELDFVVEKAKADSFKLDKEAVAKAREERFGVVLISASRDYGLDDLIFGPKELHLVKKSSVPILLINPRGDLYTLCD